MLHDASSRQAPIVVAGGSGLYFRALVDPLEFPPHDPSVRAEVDQLHLGEAVSELLEVDPVAGDYIDLANLRRVRRAVEVIRLGAGVPSMRATAQAADRVRNYQPEVPLVAVGVDPGEGVIDRIRRRIDIMLEAGLMDEVAGLDGRMGRNASGAVGYRQLVPVVRGEIDLEQGKADTVRATLALARRQRTYFGRDPRIRWLPWSEDPEVLCKAARRAIEETELWTS